MNRFYHRLVTVTRERQSSGESPQEETIHGYVLFNDWLPIPIMKPPFGRFPQEYLVIAAGPDSVGGVITREELEQAIPEMNPDYYS